MRLWKSEGGLWLPIYKYLYFNLRLPWGTLTWKLADAALGRVRLPVAAVGVCGFNLKSVPLARRVIPTSIRMHTYVLLVDFCREKPKRPQPGAAIAAAEWHRHPPNTMLSRPAAG